MSADKLIQWTSPLQQSRLKMDLVEFRRSREADFNCMSLSKAGDLLAAATVDNMITVFEVGTAQVNEGSVLTKRQLTQFCCFRFFAPSLVIPITYTLLTLPLTIPSFFLDQPTRQS